MHTLGALLSRQNNGDKVQENANRAWSTIVCRHLRAKPCMSMSRHSRIIPAFTNPLKTVMGANFDFSLFSSFTCEAACKWANPLQIQKCKNSYCYIKCNTSPYITSQFFCNHLLLSHFCCFLDYSNCYGTVSECHQQSAVNVFWWGSWSWIWYLLMGSLITW